MKIITVKIMSVEENVTNLQHQGKAQREHIFR